MELLKFSKFKLQLQSLIHEVRDLRERERAATDQLHLLTQKQKQTEEEYNRNLQELQGELASSNELREKLERKVSYLQNDCVLLENKQNDLKGTIQSLLQSRESFLNAYQESTCEMKRFMEARDRKIVVLYEKINSHLSLFDSIEKEAFAIKQVVNQVQSLVSQKEDVAAGLKNKMDHVSAFEKVFIEKISYLENKLKICDVELQRKDKTISEREAQLEAAMIRNNSRILVKELQKTLSAKDLLIQNLVSEKEALQSEVRSLGMLLQRIQETVTSMNEEDRKVFTPILIYQEEVSKTNENNRNNDAVESMKEELPSKASNRCTTEQGEYAPQPASPPCQESCAVSSPLPKTNQLASPQCADYSTPSDTLQQTNNLKTFEHELASSFLQSTSVEHQTTASALSISINDGKLQDNCSELIHLPESECSTNKAEASECHETEQ